MGIRWVGVCMLAFMLLIAVAAVLPMWLLGHGEVASALLGSCLGLGLGALHLARPHAAAPPGKPWRRLALVLMPAAGLCITVFLLIDGAVTVAEEIGVSKIALTLTNVICCLAVTPLATACAGLLHPPSAYARDAVWTVGFVWLIVLNWSVWSLVKSQDAKGDILRNILMYAGRHLEGISFVWLCLLMERRVAAFDEEGPRRAKTALRLIIAMGLVFHLEMWVETAARSSDALGKTISADVLYRLLAWLFLSLWFFYFGMGAWRFIPSTHLLWREARRVHGAPCVEATWANKVLRFELLAFLAVAVGTAAQWLAMATCGVGFPTKGVFLLMLSSNRANNIFNATSAAMLSGLLWQVKQPSKRKLQERPRLERSITHSPRVPFDPGEAFIWRRKVEELAGRGFPLRALIDFWQRLVEESVMPSFDPVRSTTNDVVRQAIIPLSRDADGAGGGKAMASIWSQGQPLEAKCMVSHCWTGLFLNLVAGVLADALGEERYEAVATRLLQGARGLDALRKAADKKQVLHTTYWVCAFSINQHASICGGFGPQPPVDSPRRQEWETKKRDTVTQEEFPLCPCGEAKHWSDSPGLCEMNKFDAMMHHLRVRVPGFSHLVVVDTSFEVFHRAWCVAEIVESDISGIPSRIIVHSQGCLDDHYESLSWLDVQDCRASRAEDKELVLAKIRDVSAFNNQLQWAIFGTQGLLSKWIDGQQRAALIGRILRRARSTRNHRGVVSRCV